MSAVSHSVLTSDGLDVLRRRGFRVLGPTVRDRTIVCDDIVSLADLPCGWSGSAATAMRRKPRELPLIQPELIAIHLRAGVLAILLPRSGSPPIVDPVLVG